MSYVEDRNKRITIFENTLQYCEREHKLVKAVENTRKNTVLYMEPLSEIAKPDKQWNSPCKIVVSRYRTLEAVRKWYTKLPQSRIGLLNFAAATIPGGGVIRGSDTQEEYLCRCTTLYPCLDVNDLWKGYYSFHCQKGSALYSNACIYTPGIIGIRTESKRLGLMREKDWNVVDVISCSVPSVRRWLSVNMNLFAGKELLIHNEDLYVLLYRRITGALQVAASHKIDILVLDVFDCGGCSDFFHMAVTIIEKALKEFEYSFKAVELALGCTLQNARDYEIFSSRI